MIPILAGNMFIHYQECKRARLMSISKDLKEATNSIGKLLEFYCRGEFS